LFAFATTFQSSPAQASLKFSVEHYAGTVLYDAAGFVSKNKDLLKPELQAVHPRACSLSPHTYVLLYF
jgi:myosin heavy subunit